MTAAAATTTYGAICDRCATPYLSKFRPYTCLCPSCYLGGLTPAERGCLLGDVAATGRRLP